MIGRFFLVCVLFIPTNNLAQDIGVDGGLPIDSAYVDKLIVEAFSIRDKEPERASTLYHTAMDKAKEIGYRKGLVKALDHLGILNGIGARYDKAIEFFEEGLRINTEANDHEGIGVSYNNLGIIFKRQGRYEEGYQVYLRSVQEFEISGNVDRLANVYYDIAAIHTQMDEWNQALYYNRKVLSIKDSLGDQIGIMMAVGGMADFYYHLGNYDSAHHHQGQLARGHHQSTGHRHGHVGGRRSRHLGQGLAEFGQPLRGPHQSSPPAVTGRLK
jgi:tetratricopeptide (TPR) repeat protein